MSSLNRGILPLAQGPSVPHRTFSSLPVLSRTEKARIIGQRALDLSLGENPRIDIGAETDYIRIAEMELEQRVLDVQVRRYSPDGKTFEDCNLRDLTITKR